MKFLLSENRVKAIRTFLLQILNTTLAVLIALSFDQLVERRRNRKLVENAEIHMDSELRDNGRDVSKVMTAIVQSRGDVDGLLKFTTDVLAVREAHAAGRTTGGIKEISWTVHPFGIVLASSGRSTAEATGALGHMDYGEVKRYAEAYQLQQEFMRIRERLSDQITAVYPQLGFITKLSMPELQSLRAGLFAVRGTLSDLEGYAKLLLRFYDNVLNRR